MTPGSGSSPESAGSRDPSSKPIVVAMTGASGVIYALRLLQVLVAARREVHLTLSPSAAAVIQQETGLQVDLQRPDLAAIVNFRPPWSPVPADTDASAEPPPSRPHVSAIEQLHYHHYQDYMTPIASGSFLTAGMVVCPCSGSTLSGIARAAASNLIQRAAEVHLKEHRKLVVVPRETPCSVLQLENMHRLASAGAVVLPAMPGWYHDVRSLDDLVDFIVSRILDQFDIDNRLIGRWGEG